MLRFIEGFDMFDSISDISPGDKFNNTLVGGLSTASIVPGRFGGNAFNLSQTTASNGGIFRCFLDEFIPAGTRFWWGGAYRRNTPTSELIVEFQNSAGTAFASVTCASSTGQLEFRTINPSDNTSGDTLQTAGSARLEEDIWYYVEIEMIQSAGSDGIVIVYVNGEVGLTFSGPNNLHGAGSFGAFGFGVTQSNRNGRVGNGSWDDIYVTDETGTVNNTRLGSSRIELRRPTADKRVTMAIAGAVPAATAHESVSDVTGFDGDVTFLESGVIGEEAVFSSNTQLSNTPIRIHGVSVQHISRKEGAADARLDIVIETPTSSPTLFPGGNLADGYITRDVIIEQSPISGADFTQAEVDDLEFGVRNVVPST